MLSFLGKKVVVDVNRPLGYRDPVYGILYPVNYGIVKTEDNKVYEAYVLGEFTPLEKYEGKVIGVIMHNKTDSGVLVVAKALNSYDAHQIRALTEFQEQFYQSDIITYEFLSTKIRNTAKALIRHEKGILVLEEKYGDNFSYHLPGGGIDFGESSEMALIREVREELGCGVRAFKHLKTVDNLFCVDDMKAHEITQIFEVTLDIDPSELDGSVMRDDLIECHFRLLDPKLFIDGTHCFFPESFMPYMEAWWRKL